MYKSNYSLKKSTKYSAGYDLKSSKKYIIKKNDSLIIDTSLCIEIPNNYVGFIKGRSGLAFKHNILAFNGTIDSDYRGEIKVLLFNQSKKDYTINKNDKIAQLVIVPIYSRLLIKKNELSKTIRDIKGFGSSGK